MDANTKYIIEALDFIKERMVTKDDVAELRTEVKGDIDSLRSDLSEFRTETHEHFASVRAEIRDIRHRLDALELTAQNSTGLTKEIDHIMERVRSIEKHLGIQHKTAA